MSEESLKCCLGDVRSCPPGIITGVSSEDCCTIIGIQQADSCHSGFLSSCDWNRFNCNRSIPCAQFFHLGCETICPGQPLTFNQNLICDPLITSNTGVFPPFTGCGTVFTLNCAGVYEVNFQAYAQCDAAIVLYVGSSLCSILPLAYTMVGKFCDGIISSSVLIQVVIGSVVALCAAPGNTNTITIPQNCNTTNESATTISFKFIRSC